MTTTQTNQSTRSFGAGDHSPIFISIDIDGNLFDFFVEVTGMPIVLLFIGENTIKEFSESILPRLELDQDAVQVVAFSCGDRADLQAQTSAANWPFRTLVDEGNELTSGFSGLSGVPAPSLYVLDPNQRVVGVGNVDELGENLGTWLETHIRQASFSEPPQPIMRVPPVLVIPRVLEPEDCDWLIERWRAGQKVEGKVALGSSAADRSSVVKNVKRREDYIVEDDAVEQRILERVMPRMVPEIQKVLHFHKWSIEAFRVGCYKAEDSGFFKVHRDNCNPSVKDRKFAVTINLNTGDYEGGDLRFPEYGPELIQPPRGGAVVFSCSMLHEVLPVTSGERFVLLTFLKQPT